jgi:hypothetical protein
MMMRISRWILFAVVILGAVGVAGGFAASSALTGGGTVSACLHQNGGAIVQAGPNGCASSDAPVDLVTPSGTVANAQALDGFSSTSFVRATGGTEQAGFIRMVCAGHGSTHSVPVSGFGSVEFSCEHLPEVGLYVTASMIGGGNPTFGLMRSGEGQGERGTDDGFNRPGQRLMVPLQVDSTFFGQARTTTGEATVTLLGSAIYEIAVTNEEEQNKYVDILYQITQSS